MATVALKKRAPRQAKKAVKAKTASADAPLKPFIVTSGGHRFRFTPDTGGYCVTEIGVRGVNTQGDTFEEALANALDASEMMAELREEMAAVNALAKKACP